MITKRRVVAILLVSIVALLATVAIQVFSVNHFLAASQKEFIERAISANPDVDITELARSAGEQLSADDIQKTAVLKSLIFTWIPWFIAILFMRTCTVREAALFVPALAITSYPIFASSLVYLLAVFGGVIVNLTVRKNVEATK